jgi:hypothetical protein
LPTNKNLKYGTVKNTPNILQIIKGKNRKAEGQIQITSGSDIAIRQPNSLPNHHTNNSFYLSIYTMYYIVFARNPIY